jgi:hypothetical protein
MNIMHKVNASFADRKDINTNRMLFNIYIYIYRKRNRSIVMKDDIVFDIFEESHIKHPLIYIYIYIYIYRSFMCRIVS